MLSGASLLVVPFPSPRLGWTVSYTQRECFVEGAICSPLLRGGAEAELPSLGVPGVHRHMDNNLTVRKAKRREMDDKSSGEYTPRRFIDRAYPFRAGICLAAKHRGRERPPTSPKEVLRTVRTSDLPHRQDSTDVQQGI